LVDITKRKIDRGDFGGGKKGKQNRTKEKEKIKN